ncbi:2Fe-2S iron-sulfur cluster-binding protein [Brachyspira alvinipulli]|uniref:2Fe-2S iron-sulfur cluster-binding protein n=1 Tax=Brachyspira alvinipulli TaxID=84379 RepID=UPI0004834EE8|nr:2Fe-2S iron-sulfur cluster-binding protein [Brachyspira alvinipulli]
MIIKFTVDGKTVSAQRGYTILQALSYVNIDIPHLCSYKMNSTSTFDKEDNLLRCRLCAVKVKKKNEETYNIKYACDEIVENGMSVLNNDEDIIKYRIALLNAILYMHKPICESCNADYICKLKKYLDIYNVSIEPSNDASNDNNVEDIKKIVKEINLPKYIKADYERCINCGICEDYKTINGYSSMIVDFCPTHVFSTERAIDDKIKEDISKTKSIRSFCIGCNYLCDADYVYISSSIKDINSPSKKKYALCDYGRKMDYYSNNTFELPLNNGIQCDFKNAKNMYYEFMSNIDVNSCLAIYSSMYPIEDINAFDELIYSTGIINTVIKKNTMSTNSEVIRDNYTNINNHSIKELKNKEYNYNFDFNDNNFNKFIILGDAIDDINDEIISFSKKNKGNYIVFSPCFSVLSYNAYLAFPISGLGEFSGHYIDKHGKKKEMSSFLKSNKNRLNLRDLLKYLYL